MSRMKFSGRNVEIQRRAMLGESLEELAIAFGLTERSIIGILRTRRIPIPPRRSPASIASDPPVSGERLIDGDAEHDASRTA